MNKRKSTNLPQIHVEPPGPKARTYIKRSKNNIRPVERRFPDLVVSESEGAFIKDVDGNVYLDFTGGGHTCNIGHRHPSILKAIRRQIGRNITSSGARWVSDIQVKLAEEIRRVSPGQLRYGRVGFCNTGSDATEFSMKLARKYSKKRLLLAFEGAYHGRSNGARMLSPSIWATEGMGMSRLTDISFIPYGYCYRCSYGQQYPDCGLYCADQIESTLKTVAASDEAAALFIEPIQVHGGVIVPPDGFFNEAKAICRKTGVLLVDDEVTTGFGRTGKMFGIEHWQVDPDILYMAKPIAGGLPLGAIVGREEIMESYFDGGGFAGNSVSCAAALTNLRVIKEENLIENASRVGEYILRRLREMSEESESIGDVRGKGMLVGVELFDNDNQMKTASRRVKEIIVEAFRRGLLVTPAGIQEQVLRISPPLNLTLEEADYGIRALEESIKKVCT